MNEELKNLILRLNQLLLEEGYDFLLVAARERKDAPGIEGFTGISYKSPHATLPAMIFGGCSKDEGHQRFVQDLLRISVRIGREAGVLPPDDEEPKVYPS